MSVRVVSLDAAHTLMDVRWHPGRFAYESAAAFGIELPRESVESYDRMLATRWRHYRELNAARDHAACDVFWVDLTRDWLASLDGPVDEAAALASFAGGRMYDAETGCFTNYQDTIATLDRLRTLGFVLVVLSNWDYSLVRTLHKLDLLDRVDHVFPSLEYGVEKPDVELFRIVEKEVGAKPSEILHVGDNPVDDFQGAIGAGWHAALLDRNLSRAERPRLSSLLEIEEALAWIG